MSTRYSSNSISGYSISPPPDDGTVSEANKIKYSTIKSKLSDPIKTLVETINSELATHFDNGPTAITTNTTLGATHYNQIIQVSGSSVTLTLTDAATLTAGWFCEIVNTDSSNTVTLGRATGADTINGTAANYSILAGQTLKVFVNAAANGFFTEFDISLRAANNFTANQAITSTDAGAAVAPTFTLDRNSASPAAADVIGGVLFNGRDSGAGTDTYAQIQGEIIDTTAASEDGKIAFQTKVAGTLATRGYIAQGQVLGSATGGDQGEGTINATAVYDDGVQIANGWTLLDTQTISGVASISVTSKITSTYDDYVWIGENIIIANDNDIMTFQVSTNNNSSSDGSNKYWIGNTNVAMAGPATSITKGSLNNSTTLPMTFTMQFFNLMSTTVSKQWTWNGATPITGTGVVNTFNHMCMWDVPATAANAWKLSVASTMSGTFKLYGIRKT